jgi:hypothetical protein
MIYTSDLRENVWKGKVKWGEEKVRGCYTVHAARSGGDKIPISFAVTGYFQICALPAGPDDGERSRQKTERGNFIDDNHV